MHLIMSLLCIKKKTFETVHSPSNLRGITGVEIMGSLMKEFLSLH